MTLEGVRHVDAAVRVTTDKFPRAWVECAP